MGVPWIFLRYDTQRPYRSDAEAHQAGNNKILNKQLIMILE